MVQGGMSEMQIAEESMARSEGVPVIKMHMDKEWVHGSEREPYLKALFEAMKTKPRSETRTITYYPEAVVLKGTVKKDEEGNKVFVREN